MLFFEISFTQLQTSVILIDYLCKRNAAIFTPLERRTTTSI